MLTAQEIFDKVARHLLTQKEKSFSLNSKSCAYRSPNGLKCAIGCLISDNDYNPNFEGHTVYNGNVQMALLNSNIDPVEHSSLLRKLQRIHDQDDDGRNWSNNLKYLAEKFELNCDVLKEFENGSE